MTTPPLTFIKGDATQPQGEGPKILVHVCNDLGKWGKGFVVALSRRWKSPEQHFKQWAAGKTPQPFQLGEVQFVQVEPELWVANLIGQHGVRTRQNQSGPPPIRYSALKAGLHTVARRALQEKATVHMPRIGTGLAGGEWEQVQSLIEETLVQQGVSVTVYVWP